jgi:transposase
LEKRNLARHKKGAQEQGARIGFIDESGFSKTPSVQNSWSIRGKTPVIRHYHDRARLNLIACIDCEPDGTDADLLFYMQPTSVVSATIIDFLDALHREIPGKIVLIWDGLSAHQSKVVKDHIAKCADWLTVKRFPAYAPELNPVEYMFSAIKRKDLGNLSAVSVDHIAVKLEEAVDRLADNQATIQGFLRASELF